MVVIKSILLDCYCSNCYTEFKTTIHSIEESNTIICPVCERGISCITKITKDFE